VSRVVVTSNGTMRLELNAPHTAYKNAAGKRVASVTTVIGVLGKEALIKWAAEEERSGVLACMESGEALPDSLFYETKRDRAANVGTIAHAMAEAFVNGLDLETDNLPPELVNQALFPFERFRAHWITEGLELVESEVEMVSERWQVGGTADLLVRNRHGVLGLMDLKTSKASKWWPYDETFAQVAAYTEMWMELSREPVEWMQLFRIGNAQDDPGQLFEVNREQWSAGLDLFTAALAAYRAKARIKR